MPTYHLYGLRNGSPVDSADVDAESEDEAVRLAQERFDCDTVEIWSDDRRLRTAGGRSNVRLDIVT
jgi:hypothetical protein